MNIFSEMERLTEPQFVKATVRVLPREEIEQLQASGQITPIEQVRVSGSRARVSLPPDQCFSDYTRRARNVRRYC